MRCRWVKGKTLMLIMQFHKGNKLRQQDWLGRISAFLVFKLLCCSCQSHLILRQSLWDFFRAAFPRATYCLASATLTDSAVKDIQRNSNHFMRNRHKPMVPTAGSLGILRENFKILFKRPIRPEIFLQVDPTSTKNCHSKYFLFSGP